MSALLDRPRRAASRRLLLSLVVVPLLGLLGCESDEPTFAQFSSLPENPPYAFAPPVQSVRGAVGVAQTEQNNAVVHDCDGDGDEDYLVARDERVRRFSNRGDRVVHDDSLPLDPGYGFDGLYPIHTPVDVDGDGHLEISLSGPSQAGDRWRFWFLDTRAWKLKDTFDLPTPDGLRADGKWDGSFAVQAVIDVPTESGPRRALLISVTAGYDGMPRGMLAVDCATHEVLWRSLAGPKVVQGNVVVHDFDGDGHPEIYYGCSGVGNVNAEQGLGYSDELATVFALNADGSRRWVRRFARQPSSATIFAADLDGDTKQELLLCHGSDSEGAASALEILDPATGDPIASWTCGSLHRRPLLLPRSGGTDVVVATLDKRLVRLAYHGGEFQERAWAQFTRSVHPIACVDLIGDGEPQVFLRLGGDQIVALDASLSRILAWRAPDDTFPGLGGLLPWQVFGRTHAMPVTKDESRYGPMALEPLEAPPPEGLIGFVSGAVAVFVLGALSIWSWWRRHRRQREAAPPDGLLPKRDLQLRLLNDLAAESHGQIGALKVGGSIIWLVGLRADGHLPDLTRLRDQARKFDRQSLPNLEEILDRCEAAGFPLATTDTARSELARVREIRARLKAADYSVDSCRDERADLKEAWRSSHTVFRTIRDELEETFTTDLPESLARVLELHAGGLDGITVTVSNDLHPRLRIHRDDLEFVLDNLVDNAIKALKGHDPRTIEVTIHEDMGVCTCDVVDSGAGMIADLQARLGRERVSRRRGGGLGWLNSRQMLERYGGSLTVITSTPDVGTHVRLVVPLARDRQTDGDDDEH